MAGLLTCLNFLGYPFSTQQEKILSSELIKQYENGDDSGSWLDLETCFKENFHEAIMPKRYFVDDKFRWVGEAYLQLFMHFKRSFAYIFAYIPLEEMVSMYDVYHEMWWDQLFIAFDSFRKNRSLLRILLKNKRMSVDDLSAKSGVNYNSIDRYARSDGYLSKASLDNIYHIAKALDVDVNIFVSEIEVFEHHIEETPYQEAIHSIADYSLITSFRDYGQTDLYIADKNTKFDIHKKSENDILIIYYSDGKIIKPISKFGYRKLFMLNNIEIVDFDNNKKKTYDIEKVQNAVLSKL